MWGEKRGAKILRWSSSGSGRRRSLKNGKCGVRGAKVIDGIKREIRLLVLVLLAGSDLKDLSSFAYIHKYFRNKVPIGQTLESYRDLVFF